MKLKPTKCKLRPGAKRTAELAAKLSNDIAESVDCGESREQLRRAIAWWADRANQQSVRVAQLESDRALVRMGWNLMRNHMDETTLQPFGYRAGFRTVEIGLKQTA